MPESNRFLDLGDYWRMVRSRAWIPLLCAVLVGGLGASYVLARTPTYVARAKVVVTPVVSPLLGTLNIPTQALAPNLETEAEVVKSTDLAQRVIERLQLKQSPEAVAKGVRVTVVTDSDVMYIGYEDPSPTRAAELAQAFAETYVEGRTTQFNDAIDKVVKQIDEETLPNLTAQLDANGDPVQQQQIQNLIFSYTTQKAGLQAAKAAAQGGQVVERATVPSKASGLGLVPAMVLGTLLGLMLGAGIAIVRGLLDDRVGTSHELSDTIGAPALGVIPTVEDWTRRSTAELEIHRDPGSATSESYRTLATNLRFVRAQRGVQLLVVTSALPGEGKSATATNLSVVLAETGLRTLYVDGDLRRPRGSAFLKLPGGPGLREALEGVPLQDLIQETDIINLVALGSGAPPGDPVSLLADPYAASVFERCRDLVDVVVCDSPPTLPVADASILAELSDGVLIVHDPAISSRTALTEAVAQLHTAGATIVGGIYNHISASQRVALGFANYDSYYGPPRETGRPTRAAKRPAAPSGDAERGWGGSAVPVGSRSGPARGTSGAGADGGSRGASEDIRREVPSTEG